MGVGAGLYMYDVVVVRVRYLISWGVSCLYCLWTCWGIL